MCPDDRALIQLTPGFPEGDARAFFDRLAAVLAESPRQVKVDCSALDRITSRGVGLLWKAYCECASSGTSLLLESPSHGVVRTLSALDLGAFFGLEPAELPTAEYRGGSGAGEYVDAFPATESEVDRALTRFGDYVRGLNMETAMEAELQTLFYEAVTNIRLHGGLTPPQRVEVQFSIGEHDLRLCFKDPGPPFDPTTQKDDYNNAMAAQRGQIRGFGLAMMRRMADEMTYTRESGRLNVLTLLKRRRKAP